MPVKISQIQKVAKRLGFDLKRQKVSHARWIHPDSRSTTIPIHGDKDIGGWLFHEILSQMGITKQEFEEMTKKK